MPPKTKPTNHPFDPPAEVLIVDNDQSHAETVAESLERVGCRCRVATSGNEGARLIEESPFDVVITDLVMNDIDGLGILARVEGRPARRRSDPHDRPRHGPLGRRGHAQRGLQLSAEAAGHRPASGERGEGRRKLAAASGPTSN